MNRISALALSILILGLAHACSKPPEDKPAESEAKADEVEHESVVTLPAESQKLIGLSRTDVEYRTLPSTLATTCEIAADPGREAHVTTRVAGRVVAIRKTLGDHVRAGETLALLESVELGQAESDYLEAQARYDLASKMLARQRKLFEDRLTAAKEMQSAENEARLAEISLEKSVNKLKLLGFGAARLAQLARTRKVDPIIPLSAPIAGIIVSRHITVGEMLEVNAAEPAFTLSDMSVLWVDADIYEKDLARVKEGQVAVVTTAAYPGRFFKGHVTRISATLDKQTRTASARIEVANPDGRLKPGMFANVRIDTGRTRVLAVPWEAVQQEGKQTIVFVPQGADRFEERKVELGPQLAGFYPVRSGLKAGEAVVTRGSFELRSQARKGTFGEED